MLAPAPGVVADVHTPIWYQMTKPSLRHRTHGNKCCATVLTCCHVAQLMTLCPAFQIWFVGNVDQECAPTIGCTETTTVNRLQDLRNDTVLSEGTYTKHVTQVLTFPEEQGHIIQNALIIQHNIERQVLVDNEQAGFALIRAQSRAQGSAAAIINRCYTAEGAQVYARKDTVTIVPVNSTTWPRLQRQDTSQLCMHLLHVVELHCFKPNHNHNRLLK